MGLKLLSNSASSHLLEYFLGQRNLLGAWLVAEHNILHLGALAHNGVHAMCSIHRASPDSLADTCIVVVEPFDISSHLH